DEDQLVRDFLSIDITSVELKVVQKGPLEICAVSLSIRKCFEIRCDCQNVPGEGGLRTSNINPLCSAKEHTSSLQDRPCQENNTVETSENKTSNHYQSEGTSSKAEKSFKDQSTGFTSATFNLMQSEKGKDFSPWFTTGVFVGGFVFGLIISMTFSYLCNRRRRTGAEKEKPEYSMGQDIPLLNSHLPVKDTPVYSEISEQKQNNKPQNNGSTPLYSSPVYVGEYVEPVTMNGNARLLQDNQSNDEHNLPIHAMYTEPIGTDQTRRLSDLCNNEYSHLQFNGESQLRTQGKKECDETSNEAKAESTENNQTEHDEDPVGAFDGTNKILDKQQREASEIESNSALSDLSDKEGKDIANNANQALLSNGKENEYFVLEKNEP
ncbi:uncharacterized protein LOC134281178, partial [Saccostrea cucullata]|uniref:uncharacterized protein LOC134281178 n=1 Tax=Saccostrea cuccullata TaxID=36930 RepID=UPI002ED64CCA